MFNNYIKFAIRNLMRQKLYSAINISGLAIGITGSLLILTYVFHELSYENFHENRANIYRAAVEFGGGGNSMQLAGAMPALGPAAKEELPEVIDAARFYGTRNALLTMDEQTFTEPDLYFADPSVFNIFSFKLISGDIKQVLNEPYSLVISQKMARKYFGDENPVGKTLIYQKEYPVTITGLMQDVPENTHLKIDFLLSYSTREKIKAVETPWNQFGDTYTYLLLQKNTDIDALTAKIHAMLKEHTNEGFAGMVQLHLQPLGDIYMYSKLMGELSSGGNISYVYLFSFVAFLVLIIASLNYINLSTARSFHRSKEIGMRKVLGAGRMQLVRQFIGESVLFTAIAMVLSLILFELLFPKLNQFLNSNIGQQVIHTFGFYTLIIAVFGFVSLFAGYYPALFLSRFKPAISLKGESISPNGKSTFRKSLVVAQFVISIFLIIGVLVIRQQVSFMKDSPMGFEKQNVLLIPFKTAKPGAGNTYEALKNRISADPNVLGFSGAYTVPGLQNKEQQSIALKGSDDTDFKMIRAIGVDYDYIKTLGLEVTKGRAFSKEYGTDKDAAIILNEKAVSYLGIENNLFDQELQIPGGPDGMRTAKVIGVIKDFNVQSMQNEIEPLFLYINPERFYTLAVRFKPGTGPAVLQSLEQIWKETVPDATFNFSFLSNTYDELYQSEDKIGQMITVFSILAIFISCLGLFGLASFTVERKTKEIGVRKVLGASVLWIVIYLSRQFVKWVILASVIAWPLSWFIINRWLQGYAYRVDINWWIFLIAGGTALIIALGAVSFKAIKAAVANPVEALRYE
jgi:putative ABC transport system permease protein